MVKNKYIILPFLFAAWAIIFAHSVIPHHHHQETEVAECTDCSINDFHFLENSEINDCDHESHDIACHFHVEILVKGSIDSNFISNIENSFFNFITSIEILNSKYFVEFISDQIPKTDYLRGPPIIS